MPTGVPALDDALGGGLPPGRLTELVSTAAGTGGQSVVARILHTTRQARQRVALIDAADGFVPDSVPFDDLRHLVWVRPAAMATALAAADVLVRDGNYVVIILDLRGLPERALRSPPASHWHRLHRAAAILVQTTADLVPAVPWRLALREPLGLDARRATRDDLVARLQVEMTRGHVHVHAEELAG